MIKAARASGLERLELRRLTDRLARLLTALQEAADAETPFAVDGWAPPVDLCETGDRICVRIELPGVTAQQIKVALKSNELRVSGEKKRNKSRSGNVSHLCSERGYGRFKRVVPVRWPICVKDATAELSNGMLVIHLPKIKDRRGAAYKVPIRETESAK